MRATQTPTARAIQRVLLVDDNDADNALHAIYFHRAGFAGELHQVCSGADALDLLGTVDLNLPTLIVLDLHMPGMDGLEFARAAAAHVQQAPVTAVLLLSAHHPAEEQIRAGSLPLVRHTAQKPLSIDRIRTLLQLAP